MTHLLDALQRLHPPGHICSIYGTQDEQFASAIPFIRLGLERDERCIYVADSVAAIEAVSSAMKDAGIACDDAARSGALVLATKDWAYFRDGRFRPDAILAFWREQVSDARRSGYAGLRATAEMDWVMQGGAGAERWVEYESLLTNTLAELGGLALCQYNRRVCSPPVILNGIRTHPMLICEDCVCENFYFVPPDEFLAPDFTEREVDRRLRNVYEREQSVHDLKLFRTLIDRSNDAIEVVDMETLRFLDVNEKACADLGYSRQELLSLSVFDIDPAIDRTSISRINDELRKAGSFVFESKHLRKDGSTFPVEVNVKFVQLDRSYTVAVVRDITERKRAESKLLQSEERFRQMAENIREIFWLLDPKTLRAVYVSPAFEAICERPVSSLVDDPLSYRSLIHPDDAPRILALLAELAKTKRLHEEFRIVCPSGVIKWMQVDGFTVNDAEGNVTALVGTSQEITARKQMEAALLEREDRYRDLVEHSCDLICTHDLEGRFLSMNELPGKILGYSRDEILNTPMRSMLPAEVRPQFDDYLATIRRDGVASGLLTVLTKSGERRIWEYHNTLRTEGVSKPIVRGIAHDVTEQKRIEKALRISEEKFSKAFRASPEMMSISSLSEARFIEVNEAFERQSEYRRDEIIGRTDLDLGIWLHTRERDELRAELSKGVALRDREVHLQTRSGQVRIVSVSTEIIELEGRQCLLAVGQDITSLKNAEDDLRRLSARLMGLQDEERRRIARELHDSTAQELTGLRMNLGIVRRSAKKLDPKGLRALFECQDLAEKCAREIRTASYLLHPPLLDDFGLVFALRGYLQGFGKRSGLRIKLNADPSLEQTRLPQELETNLFRIVQEGLTNIKQHSGSPTAAISLKQGEHGIALEIRDKGHGIRGGVAKAVAKGDVTSVGVGLSGMRERVRQLGGEFTLETSESGTNLSVVLPLDRS